MTASTESCRVPAVATGAEWLVGPVQMGGRRFDVAYYCNLVWRGTGSLTFTLGDDKDLLTDRTIRFGDTQDLTVDVSDVTRLRIQVTETGLPEGSGQTSQIVLGTPILQIE